ncbi:glycerol kinase [Rhinocladiella mackenziei CBS 650.93]|uniref:glycerol kinase n=1 Tax=Rhinocladiella mackenziei CBS 650.93 TaxID=1442369 RepID=A0A0D2G4K7_9EURO|nr:glycerol kinase [Rhinocladiella mackenziei CBS 650.93]KIX09632.1 glycerol kinase [Rhinocladiella mackenziei CBS 650.93]
MGDTARHPSHEIFVGSIDQGTTSTRFLIFNRDGDPIASHQVEFKQMYPHPGWHEHDPLEIISSVEECIEGAVKDLENQGHASANIKAVGITNQRETTVVWNSETGEPLYNAIVWTDTRTQALVRKLKNRLGADQLQQHCGLPLSTYPSVGKLLWLLENVPKVKDAYDKGILAFGTVDAWLVYKLNGGPKKNVFVSDPTNASRTMFMNLTTLDYDEQLIDFFRLDPTKIHFPKITRSSDPEAYGSLESGVLQGTRITGCLGDQSAALVGQKGFTPGLAKNTYGTGCFLLYNVGEKPVFSTHGLLGTVAYDFGEGKRMYALEGSIAVAGSSVKFLVDNFGFVESSSKISQLAATVDDNGGVVFVTAFSGLFAPYWIDDARGTIYGITAYTQRGHIARATLEATCFQTQAILSAMEKDSGHKLSELAVDGGMSNSDLTMQTQADLIQIPVVRPQMRETTALGAAIAAGLAVGVWESIDELKNINVEGRTVFTPEMEEAKSKEMFGRWEKAVQMSRGWSS